MNSYISLPASFRNNAHDSSLIEYDEASRIVERLGRLPLATDLAGAYLHTTRTPLASYLPLLHHNSIKGTLSQMPPSSVWQYEESVFTTWELSFQDIQKKHPKATELLTLYSFLSNVEIQLEMLERGLGVVDPQGKRLKRRAELGTKMLMLQFSSSA